MYSQSQVGTVVTGSLERGIIKVGDEVEMLVSKKPSKQLVLALKCSVKLPDEGRAGENVGVLLRGTNVKKSNVDKYWRNQVPINPHNKFESEVYILSKDEGGRHTHSSRLPSGSTSIELT